MDNKKLISMILCVVLAFGAGYGFGWMHRKPMTYVQTTLHEVLPKTEEIKKAKVEMDRREVESHEQAIQHAVEVAPDLVSAGVVLDSLVAEWRGITSGDQ